MGKVRKYKNRRFRSEGLVAPGSLVTEGVLLSPENEDEDSDLVITKDCNDCPEDSAGIMQNGRCKCMCTHFPNEPYRKSRECRRNTVEGTKGKGDSELTIKDNCSECPEDSEGIFIGGQCKCLCIHEHEAVGKPEKCHRTKVMQDPHMKPSNATGVIPVIIDRKNNGSTDGITSRLPDHSSGNVSSGHILHITILLSLVLVCFLAVVFMGFCIIRRRSWKCLSNLNKRNRMDLKVSASGRLLPDRFINNPTYETTCLDLSIRIYTADEINLIAQVGQGCFGKVFKGELNGEIMAVKMVRSEHSTEALREIETMSCFAHPNILPLLGIAKNPEADAPWLLFEFMEHGDLASVLRTSAFRPPGEVGIPSAAIDKDSNKVEDEKSQFQLTHDLLTNVAMQIAEGMKYLSFQHFVHRDLAARNCLVSATGIVKISDFGLSRDVYTCDYYKIGGSKLLPIRWMAPESIIYGCFTLESDVWAYGTVLWEIYTWGKQPYYGHSNEEVVQLILDGVLLCPPSNCPPTIQEIMAGCWKTEAKDRLTFHQICERFVKAGCDKLHCCHYENDSAAIRQAEKQAAKQKDELSLSNGSFLYPGKIESEYEIPIQRNELEYLQVL